MHDISRPNRDPLSLALAVISVACAVTVTVLLVLRFRGGPTVTTEPPPDVVVSDWPTLRDVGHRIGPDRASVEIVMFSDFECPSCRRFVVQALPGVMKNFGRDVALVFRHWPLSYHRFALPAAFASECAAEQGRFFEFHDLMFALQDSLGLIPFQEIATRSGVQDAAAFGACVAEQRGRASIVRDRALAEAIGGSGTPTVVINGVKLGQVPDSQALHRRVAAALGRD